MTNKERQKGIYKGILSQYPLGNFKAGKTAIKKAKGYLENILYSRINKAFQRVNQDVLGLIRVKGTKGYYKGINPFGTKGYYSPPFKGEYPLPFRNTFTLQAV